MRTASIWISTLVVGALPASLASAEEDPTPTPVVIDTEQPAPSAPSDALAANAELMDRLLTTAAEKTIRQQKFAAAAGIVGGSILLGLGAWRLTEDQPQSQFSRGLGVMFMTLGAADLTTGIFAATRVSHEKRRLDRWEKARTDGITELELARAEGELLSSAESREGERLLVRWNGLTHALAGVFVLAFSPVPSTTKTDRVSAYVIGGLFIGTGFAAFGLSFRLTPSEAAWSEYQVHKASSAGHELSVRFSPSVSRDGFGLGVIGTF
ncbi:MAG: hypothetical protein OES69_06370 [Myxococcales bacterium]|nr:hypothetical protein [Myxococcales bacterium]MDH3843544.1 hypothetical protein [Myxococcales bacterium]